ncbi:MAG TPA: VOC family protein, partial [Planctomycetaceae bacterium]|nr:VOC family protein [Planctomycetaceae bacterium]
MISHIGIAVESLDSAIPLYKLITGGNDPHITEVPDQKVRVAIFDQPDHGNGARIELLESTDPEGPIARFIAKRGPGLHHICIYVDDIESTLSEMKVNG